MKIDDDIDDVTTPMAFEPYRFLIPVQDDTANINAVIKPFQWPVGTADRIVYLIVLSFVAGVWCLAAFIFVQAYGDQTADVHTLKVQYAQWPTPPRCLEYVKPRWEGNPKGLSGPLKGGVIIDYLAARFNFTYEMVRVTENRMEPLKKERGLFSYLFENQSDLLVVGVPPTHERIKVVDLVPWAHECYNFLVAVHDDSANFKAVIKPYQWPVWLGIAISMICVIAVLYSIQWYLDRHSHQSLTSQQMSHRRSTLVGKHYLYVFGNLVTQGGPCTSKRLPFRLVAGVWTLAAFIFVQAYNSILFTYVVATVNRPLINSINDILDSNDIQLLDPNATGVFLKIKKNLNSTPNSRCNLVSECISWVTPGSRKVFADARSQQLDAIKDNYEKTGKCGLQLAKECFMSTTVGMALQKHSRYTDTINMGLLQLQQTGIIDYWDLWFRKMPLQCSANINSEYSKKPSTVHSSLSLKNLTGAFVVLLIGFSCSLFVFLCEQITKFARRHCRASMQQL
ncbi:hypothetical protein DAPPUDRAFT_241220 [Daphnia pulex]|uniref:Ionotropic glutamate receptor C-terminal domain-containing protein n=1 Tax=Daphnia pulex TaxID=6669 RepID=E9GDQ7_DAPPU|nr:hypothetical protein DAPPUDRAFT_241220 [Daphnia pulex]|eukprot:EFX82122.1 hypothetical protein DAPPUDRAFT_241220 [Daphnia pulex]